jgi:hypothetical protein
MNQRKTVRRLYHLTLASLELEASGEARPAWETAGSQPLPGDLALKIARNALGYTALWPPYKNAYVMSPV